MISLEAIEHCLPGSRLRDDQGDIWLKNDEGTWDWEERKSEGTTFKNYSSVRMSYICETKTATFIYQDDPDLITKKDLRAWISNNRPSNNSAGNIRASVYAELSKFFDLDVEQTMTITLKIPVKNLDPMGDTYRMGREAILAMNNLYDVEKAISTVEIKEGRDVV